MARRQLVAAGFGSSAIGTRLARHRLHPLHRGVYAVGHTALPPLGQAMAAVLACGEGAAISHRSAAVLWRLLPEDGGPIDVTVAKSSRARPGLRVHRSRTLEPRDVQRLRGIPLTAAGRTLLDLGETCPDRELERALDEALVQGRTSRTALVAAIANAPGRRGAPRLSRLLKRDIGPTITRSEAEERLLALVRAADLEAPELNVPLAGYVVDFLWRRSRLVVEVDGHRFHSSRKAFEADRRRDARLTAAGYRVVRITWRQLSEEPLAVIARLAQALA